MFIIMHTKRILIIKKITIFKLLGNFFLLLTNYLKQGQLAKAQNKKHFL